MAKKITIKIDKMTFKVPRCSVPGCKNPGNFSSALVKNSSTGQLLDFCERCTKEIRKLRKNELKKVILPTISTFPPLPKQWGGI